MNTTKYSESLGLNFIRIFSALSVFITHWVIYTNFETPAYTKHASIISVLGVEIFFCLSGFLICKQGLKIIKNKKHLSSNLFVFIARRIMRTWPLYFFGLICYIIYFKYYNIELIYYFSFTQNLIWPIVSPNFFSVSWSITVEEYFYFLFPVLLVSIYILCNKFLYRPNLDNYIIVSCLVILISLFFLRHFIDINYNEWGSNLRRIGLLRIDAIAAGGLSFYVLKKFKSYKYFLNILLLLFIFSLIVSYCFLINYFQYGNFKYKIIEYNIIFLLLYSFGCSSVILCEMLIQNENRKVNIFLSKLANISYPLYIFHIIFIDFFVTNINLNPIVNFILTFIFLFLFCNLMREFIEVPILKRRPKYF